MKVSNAAVLLLGIILACLASANAGVRRGDGAAATLLADEDQVEAYEDDEEGDMERLLTKTQLKKRCPFPGEVDDVDHFCDYDDTSLYKPDKWCKMYCYVCPCWDLETYFDWKGNLIEDVCTEEFCGKKDHEHPCTKNSKDDYCCECTKCKQLEILPADHFLCEPKIPPTCEETLPDGQDICRATCPDGKGECVSVDGNKCACSNLCASLKPDKYGICPGFCPISGDICAPDGKGGCACEPEIPPTCEETLPNGQGICRATCPDGEGECVSINGKKCACRNPCETLTPNRNGRCPGLCPMSGDICAPDGKGGCTCGPECEDAIPTGRNNKCFGFCPGGDSPDACVFDGKGGCTCDPVCEDFEPDKTGNCPDICPGDGVCAPDGKGGCSCDVPTLVCSDFEPDEIGECPDICPVEDGVCAPDGKGGCACTKGCEALDPDDDGKCTGQCPFTNQECVNSKGSCSCVVDCEDATVASGCDGVCPFTGERCAVSNGECACLEPCAAGTPEKNDDGTFSCRGFCPFDEGQACVPSEDNRSCGCVDLCEFDDPDGGCTGFCPETGEACVETTGGCACEAPTLCSIEVSKKCVVPRAPLPSGGGCDGKIQTLQLIWTGSVPVQVSGQTTDAPGGLVEPGQLLTITNLSGDNDQELFLQGAGISGTSTFHISCSDDEMDGPEDCGKLQGNGKKNDEGINLWALEGLVSGKGGGFTCNTAPVNAQEGQDQCTLVPRNPPSCDTGKPDTITFLFNGGSSPNNPAAQCASSTINKVPNSKGKFHTDFECSGSVDPSSPVIIQVDGASGTVQPGQTFTVNLKSIKDTRLSNGGGIQTMEFHTSCSQPIAAGLTAGALTIVGLDGNLISNEVSYFYDITNTGNTDVEVTSVFDDQIGDIISRPFTLEPNETRRFTGTDNVPVTSISSLTNVVVVTGNTEGSTEECFAEDSVTVFVGGGLPGFGGGF